MKLNRLFIENFSCYSNCSLDLSQFSSALILGRRNHNDMDANGIGKTTIFKAIEYVLFNYSTTSFDKIVRDDTDKCRVVLDFEINGEEFRVSRSRTRKDASDFTLMKRTANVGEYSQVYADNDRPISSPEFWRDISGRRAKDTENELSKLINLNIKSFRNTVHFVQHDFSGLAAASPEQKKAILKEALDLGLYSKMEKVAKEKFSELNKDIEKHRILLESIGNPEDNIIIVNKLIKSVNESLASKETEWSNLKLNSDLLKAKHLNLSKKCADTISERNRLSLTLNEITSEVAKAETSLIEYKNKKSTLIKGAKLIIEEIDGLKTQDKTLVIPEGSSDEMNQKILEKKEKIAILKSIISSNLLKQEELKIPMPKDAVCRHCRQELTEEHRKVCQKQIDLEIDLCSKAITSSKIEINALQKEIDEINLLLNDKLKKSQLKLDILNRIKDKEKDLANKNSLHSEFSSLISKFDSEILSKKQILDNLKKDISSLQSEDFNKDTDEIANLDAQIQALSLEMDKKVKELGTLNNEKAVLEHKLDKNHNDVVQKNELQKNLERLYLKHKVYEPVLKAFSSTGIPNIIINNVLDQLQIEVNAILAQLNPIIQLQFIVEKTKADGTQGDTLDIVYYVNGKDREYDQLSGAMQLTVQFGLKLGLSFLLQKMMGVNIRFLLLDELDPAFDKSTVDAYANIIKHFQDNFTIMVITHNDRLKDKFSHAILVEQDSNMVSTAKVVSSW